MKIDASQGGTGRFFGDTFVWAHHPHLKEFVWHSPAADMAKEILQSNKINVIFDQFLIKDPGTSTPTLWHHDQTYWPVAGSQVATMWIELVLILFDGQAMTSPMTHVLTCNQCFVTQALM